MEKILVSQRFYSKTTTTKTTNKKPKKYCFLDSGGMWIIRRRARSKKRTFLGSKGRWGSCGQVLGDNTQQTQYTVDSQLSIEWWGF